MTAVIKRTTAGSLTFMCPGCDRRHQVFTEGQVTWSWNGSFDKPTFSPSVLVTWNEPSDNPDEFDDTSKDISKICHSFIRDGRIEFLGDCTHSLAGKTIDLPVLGSD